MGPELDGMLAALLDVLGHLGMGVTVLADRGNGFLFGRHDKSRHA